MKHSRLMALGSLLAFPLAAACGSDDGQQGSGGGNGGPPAETLAGQQFEDVAQLADEVIGSNEEAFQGLDFAADALESVFGAQAASAASLKQNGEGCIPQQLQDTTFEYDPPSQTYTSTQVPGAPPGGLRVFIYDVSDGAPDTTSNIGHLDVTCSGAFPNFSLLTTLNVDGVDVLNVNASFNFFDASSYGVGPVDGFLTDATGNQQIDFDPGASGGQFFNSETGFSSNFGVSFIVGDRTHAIFTRSLNVDNVDPTFNMENLSITVFKLGDFATSVYDFEFTAFVGGTAGGALSGPGTFFLIPDLGGGGGIDAVACFEGTFENMNVSAATESCALGYTIIPLPPADVDAIERGYHGLQRMYAAVEGVTTTAASIGLAALTP